MPGEDANESKAQKLAAARKKLREYQKRGAADNVSQTGATSAPTESHSSSIAGGSSISSNISEASDYDVSSNGHEATSTNVPATNDNNIATDNATTAELPVNTLSDVIANTASTVSAPAPPTAASYFQTTTPDVAASALDSFTAPTVATTVLKETTTDQIQLQQVNAIQVLIAEKAALTTELNKYRCLCRERELETEELRTQLESTTQRQEELTQRHQVQQQNLEQMRNSNAELQHKLAQAHAKQEDQAGHLDELKRLLDVMQQRATDVEHQFKEKANELEMAQLRIRQLSDEASVNQPDNRVETLTQTQFMYEQQIRDLQAMVQQLTYDKEQANNQYQSYVKHLNAELSSLSEKNSELLDECTKQQERERQLVDHISALEKDIQKNISRQDQLRKEQVTLPHSETPVNEVAQLKEQISDFELERHEFQLKIKSQEDRLELLSSELQEKQTKLAQLEEHMRNYAAEQPDQTKLLATMESDKIAASRALAQNIELKKQLDELELRFVQLTNDKADLMNKLDAEEHTNREMRANYNEMVERLRSIDERFKYKDEEMIRLSHENMELTNKAAALQRKLKRHGRKLDEHDHENEHGGHAHEHKQNGCGDGHEHSHEHEHEHNEHEHEHGNHEHEHGQHKHEHVHHDHEHELEQHEHEHSQHDHDHNEHVHDHSDQEQCSEHEHEHGDHQHEHDHSQHHHHHKHKKQLSTSSSNTSTPYLPTEEAVERLEQRFTRLMSQVADLTDEKQRLEHLVLQLQGETETIGEYITLYQTQRRMLKQREYEKAAQMQLLQHEREQLRERIAVLNNLVNSLRADMPHSITQLQDNYHAAVAHDSVLTNDTSVSVDASTPLIAEASEAFEEQQQHNQTDTQLTAQESRQILTKIQDIISEINENTQHIPDVATSQTVDHINCCLGKIEVV